MKFTPSAEVALRQLIYNAPKESAPEEKGVSA
jgi:hypothetical protein